MRICAQHAICRGRPVVAVAVAARRAGAGEGWAGADVGLEAACDADAVCRPAAAAAAGFAPEGHVKAKGREGRGSWGRKKTAHAISGQRLLAPLGCTHATPSLAAGSTDPIGAADPLPHRRSPPRPPGRHSPRLAPFLISLQPLSRLHVHLRRRRAAPAPAPAAAL